MPLSVLTGRADVMQLLDKQVFFFTTFGGEALAGGRAPPCRCCATSELPARAGRAGAPAQDGYQHHRLDAGALVDALHRDGLPPATVFDGDGSAPALEMKSRPAGGCSAKGMLWSGFHNLSLAHGDGEIDYLLACYHAVLPGWPAMWRAARSARFPARRLHRARVPQDQPVPHAPAEERVMAHRHRSTGRCAWSPARSACWTGVLAGIGLGGRAWWSPTWTTRPPRCRRFLGADSLGHGPTSPASRRWAAAGRALLARFTAGSARWSTTPPSTTSSSRAGAGPRLQMEHYPLALWQRSIDANVTGTFTLLPGSSGEMARRGAGSIINVANTYPGSRRARPEALSPPRRRPALLQVAGLPDHQGGGARLHALPRRLLGAAGSASLSPGGVEEQTGGVLRLRLFRRTLLGRMSRPADYAGAVVFLAGDGSSHDRGQPRHRRRLHLRGEPPPASTKPRLRAAPDRLVLTDNDGTLTDGRVYHSDRGEELRAYSLRDGHGRGAAAAGGVQTAIITRGPRGWCGGVPRSSRSLPLHRCRRPALPPPLVLDATGLRLDQVAYLGDDVNDRVSWR